MIPTSGLHIDQAPPINIPFRYFGTAPIFLILAGLFTILWPEVLFETPLMPESIALAHTLMLGWVTMVMFGALYQMIPVLAGLPVDHIGWARWNHVLLVIGVAALVVEFLFSLHPWLLLVATFGLGPAILLFLIQILKTLFKAPAKHPTVMGMRLSTGFLALTYMLGITFLGEYAHGFFDVDRVAMLGTHIIWGLLGWAGLMVLSVSFQVLPMFYMMPTFPEKTGKQILTGLTFSLLLMPAILFRYPDQAMPLLIASLPAVISLLHYAKTVKDLYTNRRRKIIDATYRFWLLGFASGVIALAVLALWPLYEEDLYRFLFGLFYIVGFLSAIIIGMLYKIIPFLVWFHRFSTFAGLADIPLMDDLYSEKRANIHLIIHIIALTTMALYLAINWMPFAYIGGVGLMLSGGMALHALWFAVKHHAPEGLEMPDFASFFKDMPPPPT
ncbi:MAG: hypothetical protein HQL54_11255 [Magnetococcales bacterium]|nr:hypothetical protein [Magnetococcales bacterium]